MRYPIRSLLFIGFAIQLIGCRQEEKNLVKISIDYPKGAGDTISVGRINMVNLSTIDLGKVRLDSAGKGIVELPTNGPLFAHINGKNMAAGILVYPGDEISVVPSKQGAKLAIRFEGDGAEVNEALNEGQQLRHNFEKWNGSYYFQLKTDEFLRAKDSLERTYDRLLAKLKAHKNVPEERIDLLSRQMAMHVVSYQYNFVSGKDSSEIPLSVRKVVESLPVDTIALQTGMFDYSLIASQFYHHNINNVVYQENAELEGDSLESIFPMLVERKVKAAHYPKPIEDFIRVKSADVQIGLNGLSPNMRKLAATLEKEVAAEDFKKVIRDDKARWEKIGPGKPAPDFEGMTPDGKKLALSDLRGKIVYVDIWATWCGYCIDEFPDSKKMQAEFKGSDQVAFLYVSVDQDTLAWKKMVAGNKVPNGLHMLNSAEASESIWNLYHVSGIPRYLLIDAQGRIVTTHAQRPSSGSVQAELRRLLAAKRVAQN